MAPPVSFLGDKDYQLYKGPVQDLPRSKVISSMVTHQVAVFMPAVTAYYYDVRFQDVRTTVSVETDWVQVPYTQTLGTKKGDTEIKDAFTVQLSDSTSTTWNFGVNATANMAVNKAAQAAIQLQGSRGFTQTSAQQGSTPIPISEKLDAGYVYKFIAVVQRQRVRVVHTYEGGRNHGLETLNYFYELQSTSTNHKTSELYDGVNLQVFRKRVN